MEQQLGQNYTSVKIEEPLNMTFCKYILTVLKNLKQNLHYLGKYNISDILSNQQEFANSVLHELNLCKRNLIEIYYELHKDEKNLIIDELNYIRSHDEFEVFPYPQVKKMATAVVADFDNKRQLPYVIHNQKKLYFAKDFSIESAKKAYINYIERDNLLGGGYTAKAPHQYQTESFKIEKDDILLDIGCAEALLALDSIEIVKKVYLFESDKRWQAPLMATFEPYKEKVILIPKYVSNTDSDFSTTLNSLFGEVKKESFFVKMDIEGEEENVIFSSKQFLESSNNIKIACCTYHRAHHARTISEYLKKLNYKIEFSDGYMFFFFDHFWSPPYFRKGLIRAHK